MLVFVVPPLSAEPSVDPPRAPDVIAVIPARYGSTRFPGKPLADICGRPMIEHVYRRVAAAPEVRSVIVATDDLRIATRVASFGGTVRLTRPDHATGTDRLAEVAAGLDCDVIVNVQGDEPLFDPRAIGELVAPFRDPAVTMTTLCHRVSQPQELASPHVVKVVCDRGGNALYFSRAPIPHARDPRGGWPPMRRHVGVYAYRRRTLLVLASLEPTPLERAEALEQLRALEHGIPIRVVESSYDSIGVDTPADLAVVRQLLDAGQAH